MADKQDECDPRENTGPLGSGYPCFEIHVKGHLNSRWSDWLENMDIRLMDNGEMILSGEIIDQAALMGILNKLNSLNLTILSVSEVSKNTAV